MRTGSVVHFLERFQPLLGLGLGIAVVDEKHRHKTQRNEQRSIREQDTVVDLSHERTSDDGRDDLRGHGGRVVMPVNLPISEPLHISTTMGSELTLIAAQARPTRAKTTNIMALIEENVVVST